MTIKERMSEIRKVLVKKLPKYLKVINLIRSSNGSFLIIDDGSLQDTILAVTPNVQDKNLVGLTIWFSFEETTEDGENQMVKNLDLNDQDKVLSELAWLAEATHTWMYDAYMCDFDLDED